MQADLHYLQLLRQLLVKCNTCRMTQNTVHQVNASHQAKRACLISYDATNLDDVTLYIICQYLQRLSHQNIEHNHLGVFCQGQIFRTRTCWAGTLLAISFRRSLPLMITKGSKVLRVVFTVMEPSTCGNDSVEYQSVKQLALHSKTTHVPN